MSEMIHVKQWILSFFDPSDVEYVKGLECKYEIHNSVKTIEFSAPNGRMYQYADRRGDYGLYITSQSKEQEAMLMLKYSGEIKLLREFYINEWEQRV